MMVWPLFIIIKPYFQCYFDFYFTKTPQHFTKCIYVLVVQRFKSVKCCG